MSLLNMHKKPLLEELPGIGSGYVLNFSDQTFSYFSHEAVDTEIHSEDFTTHGSSKDKNLRGFWDAKSDCFVGRLPSELIGENDQIYGKFSALTDHRDVKASIDDLDANLVSNR